METIKIIIADDQTLIRDGLASLLSIKKEVEILATAKNGEEAVKLAKELSPDIILMDIRMPVMDGLAALNKIKEINPTIKIIMLTTFDDDDYIIKSLQVGAQGYLLKDIPIDDLLRALEQAMNGTFQATNSVISRLSTHLRNKKQNDESADIENIKQCFLNLSEKEKNIFNLLGEGMTNKEIASSLNLSEGTIKNYMTNILASFEMRDRTQLALLSYKIKINSN
ncbi:MAG: response regulator transcription factor [Sphaerochaetaceae bacterium]|nr:response regulator transcription factor [Sphaerochaetaceae bacterium]MDC7237847.1 response regulator transcription factor [Sphaerochaetaceae bacterium]MDC7249727.1 response regulator transcription factor [Sphaerochaetaceae bacterium]